MFKHLLVAWRPLLAVAAMSAVTVSAVAADLRIGLKSEVSAADPHILAPANRNVWLHVYDTLVGQDHALRAVPRLARGWRAIDAATWEFVLRPNVTFHDGSPLTADDVKASIERAQGLTGPRTYRNYLQDVDSVAVIDPLKVQIKTKEPSPGLPDNISLIAIIPKSKAQAGEDAFAKGEAAIGTGPYRYSEWQRGERVVLVRNDKYWGAKEPWDKVVFQFIPKEPARASALLSGAVDLIDGTHAGMSDAFASSGRVTQATTPSYWLNYLAFDHFRASSPYATDQNGKPLPNNPLQNLKVRQAINLAISRDAIARHVMKGDSVPTTQIVPAGFFGHDAALVPPAADPAKAKALLAEAGYPQGFKLTLHCTNDRYLNDAKVCEAIGQMLSQVGLKMTVQAMPYSVLLPRLAGNDADASMYMWGIGAVTGDSLPPLRTVTQTRDKQSGQGASNYGRYSDPQLDQLIEKAAVAMNPAERENLQKAAAREVAQSLGIVPIHNLKASWAMRKGLSLTPRADGFTYATDVREGASK